MFTSILCPVDVSEHSALALRYALKLTELTGGHLTIVTVVDALLDAASGASGNRASLADQTQHEIQQLLARVAPDRKEPVGIAVEAPSSHDTFCPSADATVKFVFNAEDTPRAPAMRLLNQPVEPRPVETITPLDDWRSVCPS